MNGKFEIGVIFRQPTVSSSATATWWRCSVLMEQNEEDLGNVHKWTKTSRCVILNEIKVKTLGNQRFVFLENFQRPERKQTLPLPSWMFFSFIFPPFFVCFYFGHKSGYPRDVPAVTSCFSSFKDIPTGEIEWNGRRVVGHFKRKRKSKWVSKKSRHRSLSKQNSSVTSLEGGGGGWRNAAAEEEDIFEKSAREKRKIEGGNAAPFLLLML